MWLDVMEVVGSSGQITPKKFIVQLDVAECDWNWMWRERLELHLKS
jgi:hypothetical protein